MSTEPMLKPLVLVPGQGQFTMSRPCTVSTASWDEIIDMDWGGDDNSFQDPSFYEESQRVCDATQRLQHSLQQGFKQGKDLACSFHEEPMQEPVVDRPRKKVSMIIEGGATPRETLLGGKPAEVGPTRPAP